MVGMISIGYMRWACGFFFIQGMGNVAEEDNVNVLFTSNVRYHPTIQYLSYCILDKELIELCNRVNLHYEVD